LASRPAIQLALKQDRQIAGASMRTQLWEELDRRAITIFERIATLRFGGAKAAPPKNFLCAKTYVRVDCAKFICRKSVERTAFKTH